MQEFYYYLRDMDRRPIVTRCVLSTLDGKLYTRGTAVCSEKDSPCKHMGRKIAFGRAMKALLSKTTKTNGLGNTIFEYMPKLYPMEERFIERLRERL